MFSTESKFSLMFKVLLRFSIVLVITYGLYLNLYGGFDHQFQSWLLLFYTTQSNALVLLIFAVLCVHNVHDLFVSPSRCPQPSFWWGRIERLKIALTWAISITGIVYHVLLVSELKRMAPEVAVQTGLVFTPELWLSLDLLHTWSPLLVFLDWLLFTQKGRIGILTPFKWLLIPLTYFVFICVWVNFIGPVKPEYTFTYPYPFLDFQANGMIETCKGLVVIMLGMLTLGYAYFLLDVLLRKVHSHFFD